MDWVLDSSFALAWLLPDEKSRHAERFLKTFPKDSSFWVPALWWYEIANPLCAARRRNRISEAEATQGLELLSTLPITTDANLGSQTLWRCHALALEYNLSVYDAAYLELAQRKGFALATIDERLLAASQKAGIKNP